MSKYTTELRFIAESDVKIFDFDYPFYDVAKKPTFEQHFIDHFYFREIGSETIARFKHNLKVTFNEKLPYYNKVFETALKDYAVLANYNLDETFTRVTDNNSTIEGTNGATGHNVKITNQDTSDTENNSLTVATDGTVSHDENGTQTKKQLDGAQNAVPADLSNYVTTVNQDTQDGSGTDTTDMTVVNTDVKHITGTNDVTDTEDSTLTGTSSTENTGKTTETYTHNTKGDIGVATQMDALMSDLKLRNVLEHAELSFFNECEDLFMQIFE